MIRIFALTLAMAAATCNTDRPGPSPVPTPIPAPQPAQDGGLCQTSCCRACVSLARYQCPEGRPTARGETCEETCLNVEASGVVVLPAECVAAAKTLADVVQCGVRCAR
jgi:hypothetical protein